MEVFSDVRFGSYETFVRKKYTLLERKSCISGTEGRRDSGTRLACSSGPNYGGRVKLPSVSDVRFGSYETLYFLERKSCISGTEGRRDSGPRLACSAGPNYAGRDKLPSVSDVRFGSYETFVRKKYTLLERKSCISGTEGRRDSGPRLACSAGPNYGGRVKLPSVSDVRFGSYETFVRKKYTLLERNILC